MAGVVFDDDPGVGGAGLADVHHVRVDVALVVAGRRVDRQAAHQVDRVAGDQVELRQRNQELERFNRAATERELRMVALKREVNELARAAGRPQPYDTAFAAVLAAAAAAGAAAPIWYSGSNWDYGRTGGFTDSLGRGLASSAASAATAPGSTSGSGGGGGVISGRAAATALGKVTWGLAAAFIARQFWGWISDRYGGLATILFGSAWQALSILLFLCVLIAWKLGYIHPTGISAGQ